MLKIGITGGIGSGKTTVCKVFKLLGIPIYFADDEAKKILDTSIDVKTNIINTFGIEVIDTNGIIDRKKLALKIFNNKENLEKLNSIVHPAGAKHFENWLHENKSAKYILKEAAILFESKAYKAVDKVITVTAPIELKIQRAMQRDNTDRASIEQRIKNQLSDEEKIKRSHFIIYNDEQQLLIPQIIDIHHKLIKL
jgi:dephospho-CoA kinase